MKTKAEPLSPIRKLTAYLYTHKMRNTSERARILEAALEFTDGFTAADMIRRLEEVGYHVSTPTVYSNLKLLCDIGIISRGTGLDGKSCYISSHGPKHQIRLVCNRCGKVRTVESPQVDSVVLHRNFRGFTPSEYQLRVDGVCTRCRKEVEAQERAARKLLGGK